MKTPRPDKPIRIGPEAKRVLTELAISHNTTLRRLIDAVAVWFAALPDIVQAEIVRGKGGKGDDHAAE